jgi:two-component system response regulator QseB
VSTSPGPGGAGQAPRLLLVEDDRQLSELLTELFTDAGYTVDAALDGQSGLHRALTRPYEAMVVDRGLPAIEGAELLSRLRARGVLTPALLLTARGTLDDIVEGLDAGAEDYVVKPFEISELLARLRALLRRHQDSAGHLSLGERRLDIASRRVIGPGHSPVELSERECELLKTLATRPSRVFSRDELLDRVFSAADSPGAVDTYVHYLRRKLGRDVVHTVRGLGYRMGRA